MVRCALAPFCLVTWMLQRGATPWAASQTSREIYRQQSHATADLQGDAHITRSVSV